MKDKKNSIILIILAIIISIASSVFAVTSTIIDNSKKGSITLTAYEFINGDETNKKVLSGAEFTIYKVSDSVQNIESAESYINSNKETIFNQTLETNTNGVLTFSGLEVGRYFVKETNAPKNVLTKVESFLVDIPSVNNSGTAWEYDIEVSPKNVTVYGNATLSKTNTNGEAIEGAEFKLQKKTDNKWTDYELTSDLTTDSAGKIQIQNLEAGEYRLVETNAPNGYIADGLNAKEFTISLNKTEISLNMTNEKPEINKYVLSDDENDVKALGVDSKDIVKWKITSTVPSIISKMKTFEIKDNLSSALDIVEDTIKVYGIKGTEKTLLQDSTDYDLNQESQLVTISFNNQKLASFSNIEIEYQTKINKNVEYGKSITNEASMVYTNIIKADGTEGGKYTKEPDQNSTAEVHTGKLLVLKTDGTNALQGAKFKIATSEENAKSGIFVKNENGEDIVATSDENGYVLFYGLKYGQDGVLANSASSYYWLVEVQAPSYVENNQTKYYNLLQSPFKVEVNSSSGEKSENTAIVVNNKGFVLPKTGAIGMGVCTLVGVFLAIVAIIMGKKKDEEETEKEKTEK